MAQGIRALAFKNYPDACDHLSHAVEALFVPPPSPSPAGLMRGRVEWNVMEN